MAGTQTEVTALACLQQGERHPSAVGSRAGPESPLLEPNQLILARLTDWLAWLLGSGWGHVGTRHIILSSRIDISFAQGKVHPPRGAYWLAWPGRFGTSSKVSTVTPVMQG